MFVQRILEGESNCKKKQQNIDKGNATQRPALIFSLHKNVNFWNQCSQRVAVDRDWWDFYKTFKVLYCIIYDGGSCAADEGKTEYNKN